MLRKLCVAGLAFVFVTIGTIPQVAQANSSTQLNSARTGGAAPVAQVSQVLYGVTTGNQLIQFNSNTPCTLISSKMITGLRANERLRGIDFRPANGQLYGLGSSSRIYTINPQTGAATTTQTKPFTTTVDSKGVGFDFNPTVDRIRITVDNGQNLRVHPDTGVVVAVDTSLNYTVTDTFAGRQPRIVASAYTNPDNDPATATALYDIDAGSNTVALQNPPNNGVLKTIGQLRFDTDRISGFDIAKSGIAFATLRQASQQAAAAGTDTWAADEKAAEAAEAGKGAVQAAACGASQLVTIDLTTGRATSLGYVGSPMPVEALAAPTQ